MENKVLRHVSDAFDEDPLRVLRGVQFAARFNMSMAPETVEKCRSLLGEFDTLPTERIRDEFMKLFSKGKKISKGIKVLRATGWISKFPELEAMVGCEQDPRWHPEGDVFTHTMMVVDRV